jgi:SPP1 family predicted phage head-tail adaptor
MIPRRAGQRRHQVALQSMTGRVSDGDGYLETWATYATVWASVRPATPTLVERVVGQTQQVPLTHIVEVDYRSDLLASHRLLFGGTRLESDEDTRKLYIRGLQNEDERNKTISLACEERLR